MKRLYLTAVFLAGSLAISFVSSPASAQCVVKMGVVAPMSGAAAQWGIAMRGAAELVAAEYAEKGGLPVGGQKCKITVTTLDGKYNPEGAAAAANQLASDGIKVIIGPIGAPEVTGIKPVASRNRHADHGQQLCQGCHWPAAGRSSSISVAVRAPGLRPSFGLRNRSSG